MEHWLTQERIAIHPFVVGELALGSLPSRPAFIRRLNQMISVPKADDREVMRLIEEGPHFASGLGWVDIHLLASVLLSDQLTLWTLDRRLNAAANQYGRAARLHH